MKKWRVVVCEEKHTWEHVDLSEEEAEHIAALEVNNDGPK